MEALSKMRARAIITSANMEVLATAGSPKIRMTQVHAEVLALHPPPPVKVTSCYMEILASRSPNYEFVAMVLPDTFPFDISYNSVGSTRFATDVIVVDSGDDQRVGRWDAPLMEYDVAYGVRTMEQLMSLIQFFRAMRGRLNAFCYQDNTDYTSSIPIAYESRQAPPITMLDQFIATGDGLTYIFQLTKTYSSHSLSQVRTITRPQPGTVLMAVNGVQSTYFTEDDTTGLITFTTPFTLTFSDPLSINDGTPIALIDSGVANTFLGFLPFVGRNVTVTGFAHAKDNVSVTQQAAFIVSLASDYSWIEINYGSGYAGHAESGVTGVTISIHPAPPAESTVTAGFQFYVPCRFDTDILPVTIEDYGVGGSNSVKLIEVRISDPN